VSESAGLAAEGSASVVHSKRRHLASPSHAIQSATGPGGVPPDVPAVVQPGFGLRCWGSWGQNALHRLALLLDRAFLGRLGSFRAVSFALYLLTVVFGSWS